MSLTLAKGATLHSSPSVAPKPVAAPRHNRKAQQFQTPNTLCTPVYLSLPPPYSSGSPDPTRPSRSGPTHLDVLHVLVEQDLAINLAALDQGPDEVLLGEGQANLHAGRGTVVQEHRGGLGSHDPTKHTINK